MTTRSFPHKTELSADPPWISTPARLCVSACIFGLIYFLAARLGNWLSLTQDDFIAFWPPSGLYWAVLIRLPVRNWPPFFVAALAASGLSDIWLENTDYGTSLCLYSINTLTAGFGAALIRHWQGPEFTLNDLGSAAVLALLSTGFAFGLSAPLLTLFIGPHTGNDALLSWAEWGLSDWSGIWFTAPVVLALLPGGSSRLNDETPDRPLEAAVAMLALITVSYLAYFDRFLIVSTASLPVLCLLWITIRFGVQGVSLAVFVMAVIATRAALLGLGPFVRPPITLHECEIRLLLYLGVTSIVFHVVAATLRERTQTQRELQRLNADLERLAEERAARLVAAEKKYEALVSQSFGGIAELSRDGYFLTVNNRFCDIVGYGRDDLLGGMRIQDITHPDDLNSHLNLFNRLLEKKQPYDLEKRYIRKDGKTVWVSNFVSAVHGEDGILRSIAAMTVDITQRKTIDEEREKFVSLIEHSDDFIGIASVDGYLSYLNSAGRRMIGLAPDINLRGIHIRDYVAPESLKAFDEEYLPALNGNGSWQGEMTLRDQATGRRVEVSRSTFAILNRTGERVGYGSVTRDITEERRNRDQLMKLSLAVEQSPVSILITDLNGDIEYVNDAFVRITGYEKLEVIGRNPSFLGSGQTPKAVFAELWSRLSSGLPWQGELYNRRKHGEDYIDAANIVPVRQPNGRISHYVAVQEDVTEKRRQEEELQKHRCHLEKLVEERTDALQSLLRKLAYSEENIRLVMESAQMPILLADSGDRFIYGNPAALATLGMSADQLAPMSIAELTADCDQARLATRLADIRNGHTRMDTWHLKHNDGHAVPFELMTQELPDGRFLAMGFDKTERIATERELHLAASVFENTFEGILITSPENVIVNVNEAFVRLTGFSREEAIGQNPRLLNSGQHDQAFFESMRRSYQEQGHWQGEIWNRCKDGRLVAHQMNISAVYNEGELTHYVGLFTDITDRKLSEIQLHDSEERLRLATESANIGLWSWDFQKEEVVCSDKLKALLGLPVDWVCAYPACLDVLHGEDRAIVKARVEDVLANKTGLQMEFRIRRPELGIRWLSGTGQIYCDDQGEARRLTGVLMDITDRKLAEQRLQEQQAALEANDRQKDEFIAMLSHEIRNPLAAINNAIAVLHRNGSGDQNVKWVEQTIGGQLKQLNRLVGDLMDVSRITHGKFELKITRIAVSELIDRAVEMSRPVIAKLTHNLRVTRPADPLFLDGDMTRLVQVIDNLLHNAAKYTPTGGHIELEVKRERDKLAILVRDDGVGIPPDMLSSVFTLFTQGPPTQHSMASGMGIGLSLVERLVELHNGSISVTSGGPGKGTEFCVLLPLAEQRSNRARTQQANDTQAAIQEPSSSGLRILIVDDEPAVADSFAMLLGLMGHEVAVAYSGHEAFEQVEAFGPDVVFLDIGLPDMSGFDIIRRFNAIPVMADTPVIALTGFGQERDIQRTAEAGFAAHMTKPVDPERLESLLESLSQQKARH